MARQNYEHEKRQKDLAKKRKKEEKRQRKQEKNAAPAAENQGEVPPGDEVNAEPAGNV